MSNVNHFIMKTGHCGICKPSDEETKLIQDSLFDRLNAILHNMKLQDEGNEDVADETLGFQRLVKIIFHKKYKNFKISTQCKHH